MTNNNYRRRYFVVKPEQQEQLWKEYKTYIDNIYKKLEETFSDLQNIEGYEAIQNSSFGIETMTCLVVSKIPDNTRGLLIEERDKRILIKGNNRTKRGKNFLEKIQTFNLFLKNNPNHLSPFLINKFNLKHGVRFIRDGKTRLGYTTCYTSKTPPERMIIDLPTADDDQRFPVIPEYFIELKKSEYFALMGE